MHTIYKKLKIPEILEEFVKDHNISDKDLDYVFSKTSLKSDYEIRLIRSEHDSLLFSFEKDNIIIELYQLVKEGKFFRVSVPTSILNYINSIRRDS